jgi:hypothetical protein
MNVIILDSALEDLLELTNFFESRSEGLGMRFRQSVEKSLGIVIDFPRASAVIRKGYRIRQIKRFRKYGILYRIKHGCIFVHGIFYLSRGPQYWSSRLG